MKHLASKLSKIVGEMGESIKMTGWNNHQKFAYMKEKDIVESLRVVLTKHNVILLTSVEDTHKEGELTTVKLKHTLIDGDSGETIDLYSSGTGQDKTQFGMFKAITGSFKFFLMKNFLISGEESDPENDIKDHAPKQAQGGFAKPEPAKAPTGFNKPKPAQAAPVSPAKKSGFFGKQQPQAPVETVETAPEEPGF